MKASELQSNEYSDYYKNYVYASGELSLLDSLKQSSQSISSFLESIPEDKWSHAYGEGKWTIKQLVHHIIDTERVFSYRAMRFARKDATNLPGFEQDDYVINANANNRTKESLIKEYKAVKEATVNLFETFSDANLKQIGTASNTPMSVRAIGFVAVGHEKHHINVLRERYL